jgi:hypothetical protein
MTTSDSTHYCLWQQSARPHSNSSHCITKPNRSFANPVPMDDPDTSGREGVCPMMNCRPYRVCRINSEPVAQWPGLREILSYTICPTGLPGSNISELLKRQYPNIALLLHDAIRQRLKEGTAEPVLIASEALRDIEKLNGQIDSNEEPPIRTDDRNRLGRTVGFATGLRS